MSCNTFPDAMLNDHPIVKEELVITDTENDDSNLEHSLPRLKKIKFEKENVYDDDSNAEEIEEKFSTDGNECLEKNANIFSCDNCTYQSVQKHNLRRHIIRVHDLGNGKQKKDQIKYDVRKYIVPNCSNCKKQYTFEYRYVPKVCLDCKIKLQYECTQCHKQLKNFDSSARKHVKEVCLRSLNPNIFSCNKCTYKSTRKIELQKHIKWMHQRRNEKQRQGQIKYDVRKYIVPNCSNCKKQYKFDYGYIPKVCLDCNKKLQYECTQCHKQLKNFDTVAKRHLKEVCVRSLSLNILSCDNCTYQSVQKDNLRQHIIRMHDLSNEKQKEGQIKYDVRKYIVPNCSNCKKQYKFEYGYIPKMCLDCNKKLQYECTQCHEQLKNFYSTATAHLKEVCLRSLNPNIFSCDNCTYQSVQKHNLRRHIKRMHDLGNEKQKEDYIKYDLRKYIVPNCSNCKKQYTFEYRYVPKGCLDCNIKLQYECTQCHKQLKSFNSSARKHLKEVCLRSLNPNIFSCDNCTYQSVQKQNLRRHIARTHIPDNQKQKEDQIKYD